MRKPARSIRTTNSDAPQKPEELASTETIAIKMSVANRLVSARSTAISVELECSSVDALRRHVPVPTFRGAPRETLPLPSRPDVPFYEAAPLFPQSNAIHRA